MSQMAQMEMEGIDLSAVPVPALEALRIRLTQLTHSLNSLQVQIQQASLPSWPSLQGQFNVILTQLTSLSATLANYSEVLQRTVSYPLPNFPTATEFGLLTTLLRKKNLPEVQEWIDQGQEAAQNVHLRDDDDFTQWAREVDEECKNSFEWEGFRTREEIDAGVEDSGVGIQKSTPGSGYSADEILSFLSTGQKPRARS